MRKTVFAWLDREFVALACEGRAGLAPGEQTIDIFRRFGEELGGLGLSLDHTVRTRLFSRDRESRGLASQERLKILSGGARSVSSSYVAPGYFESDAQVAMELLAMRPSGTGAQKTLQEYDPPAAPLRYLVYDSVVFLSGVAGSEPTLADQATRALANIQDSLAHAGVSWDQTVRISSFLHRSQPLAALRAAFPTQVAARSGLMEFGFVDGYAGESALLEIEVTALS